MTAGERGRLGPSGGHQDRHRPQRRAVQAGLVGGVELTGEIELLAGEEAMDDLQSLPHPGDALLVTGKRPTQRSGVDVLAGSDPEDEPTPRQPVDGRGRLGDECRVVVEEGAGHAGDELNGGGAGRYCTQPAPDEPGSRILIDPRVEMVRSQNEVEAHLLCQDRLIDQHFGLVRLMAAQPAELHPALLGSRGASHPSIRRQ